MGGSALALALAAYRPVKALLSLLQGSNKTLLRFCEGSIVTKAAEDGRGACGTL